MVLATFPNELAADSAAEALKAWDKVDDDVKLKAIGVLVLDEHGKVKTNKLGRRSTAMGAGVGIVLALVVPPVGVLAGAGVGALLGHLHHKGLGMSTEDREKLRADLAAGKAAVGVLIKKGDPETIATKLTEQGGEVKVHELDDADMAEADAAAPAVEAAGDTAPEAAPES